jgi:hypothetical protein
MAATSSDHRNTQGQVAEHQYQQSRDQPIVDKRTLEGALQWYSWVFKLTIGLFVLIIIIILMWFIWKDRTRNSYENLILMNKHP